MKKVSQKHSRYSKLDADRWDHGGFEEIQQLNHKYQNGDKIRDDFSERSNETAKITRKKPDIQLYNPRSMYQKNANESSQTTENAQEKNSDINSIGSNEKQYDDFLEIKSDKDRQKQDEKSLDSPIRILLIIKDKSINLEIINISQFDEVTDKILKQEQIDQQMIICIKIVLLQKIKSQKKELYQQIDQIKEQIFNDEYLPQLKNFLKQ